MTRLVSHRNGRIRLIHFSFRTCNVSNQILILIFHSHSRSLDDIGARSLGLLLSVPSAHEKRMVSTETATAIATSRFHYRCTVIFFRWPRHHIRAAFDHRLGNGSARSRSIGRHLTLTDQMKSMNETDLISGTHYEQRSVFCSCS